MEPGTPINAERLFWELSPRLPENCLIACDCGMATLYYARTLRMRAGMFGSLSGTLLSMGGGMPYAIAAKFAHPDQPVVAVIGDGAMQMNGVNEMITVAKYWQQWSDPRFVVLVLNNRDLNFVSWEQRASEGDIRYEASQALPDVPYARHAELLGLAGVRLEQPDAIADGWERAF